jgi:hypothetical protein
MKKLLTLLMCAVLFGAIAILPACKGPGKTVAYKTLRSVSDAVDGAMKAYADAVVAGAIDAPMQDRVRMLHGQYRKAFAQALNAARFDYENAAPGELAGLAAELTTLIATYAQ